MNKLAQILVGEIQKSGAIPFARFMEAALYCPNLGFYDRSPDVVGIQGAFYTSPTVGNCFGRLLGFEWLRRLENITGDACFLVEAGAHDGTLARDILEYLENFAGPVWTKLRYVILEPSESRRAWQAKTLARYADKVRWLTDWEEADACSWEGVLFANELLDAFPVHRLVWNAGLQAWQELGVVWEQDAFEWRRLDLDEVVCRDWLAAAGIEVSPELAAVLPDGYVLDVSPAAGDWWRRAASWWRRGSLAAIDYGWRAEEFVRPEKVHGTLRGYRDHRVVSNVLQDPGEQDLTAHVNFTQIERAGEAKGWRTTFWGSQESFLMGVAGATLTGEGARRFPGWGRREKAQLQTLTHPDQMGRLFRVLIQEK